MPALEAALLRPSERLPREGFALRLFVCLETTRTSPEETDGQTVAGLMGL